MINQRSSIKAFVTAPLIAAVVFVVSFVEPVRAADSAAQEQAQAARFIEERIKSRWKVAQVEGFAGKHATVFFRIGSGGAVFDLQIKESSADPAFDALCLEAVKEAGPLPLSEATGVQTSDPSRVRGVGEVSVILDFKACSEAEKESLRAHLESELAASPADELASKSNSSLAVGELLKKALLEEKLGKFSEAIADFEEAARLVAADVAPDETKLDQWVAAVHGCGDCRARAGDWQGARRTLSDAVERAHVLKLADGKIVDILELYARVLYKVNMPAQAAQMEVRLHDAKNPGAKF